MTTEYYVSMEGNDANPGTVERPFKSIERALQLTESEKRSIYLRRVTYGISDGLYCADQVSSEIRQLIEEQSED
ncbi:MAG: DUF1565 domain-containing protein [Phormidesmis sp.]